MNVAQTLPKRYQKPCNLHINQSFSGGCFRPLTPETGVRFPLGLFFSKHLEENHQPAVMLVDKLGTLSKSPSYLITAYLLNTFGFLPGSIKKKTLRR